MYGSFRMLSYISSLECLDAAKVSAVKSCICCIYVIGSSQGQLKILEEEEEEGQVKKE